MRDTQGRPLVTIIRSSVAQEHPREYWAVHFICILAICVSPVHVAHGAEHLERRTGPVRLDGRSFADDGGKFNALGASLFYGAWAYKHDRPRLERNLATLSRNGFDY